MLFRMWAADSKTAGALLPRNGTKKNPARMPGINSYCHIANARIIASFFRRVQNFS